MPTPAAAAAPSPGRTPAPLEHSQQRQHATSAGEDSAHHHHEQCVFTPPSVRGSVAGLGAGQRPASDPVRPPQRGRWPNLARETARPLFTQRIHSLAQNEHLDATPGRHRASERHGSAAPALQEGGGSARRRRGAGQQPAAWPPRLTPPRSGPPAQANAPRTSLDLNLFFPSQAAHGTRQQPALPHAHRREPAPPAHPASPCWTTTSSSPGQHISA